MFFFKQKTAYEMRISDWSSDVCSSDLYVGYGVLCTADGGDAPGEPAEHPSHPLELCPVCTTFAQVTPADLPPAFLPALPEAEVLAQIGRASCRERVCQYV